MDRLLYNVDVYLSNHIMAGIIRSPKIKREVTQARKRGKTYRELTQLFGVPKSTLSYWFGDTLGHPYDRTRQLEHLAKIRILAHASIRRRIENRDNLIKVKVAKDIKLYPIHDPGTQKLFLSALYWAEGAKHKGVGGLKFVNTDPKLCELYIKLLRNCYSIEESKLKIRLHLHYYHGIKETRVFWSKLLNVPENQFGKIYIKKRSITKKFRRNFGGICFIYYGSSDIRRELLEIAKQFSELIVIVN